MKNKFSKMGRVAIVLVLALSLSLVMAVPVSAAEGAALTVTITQPAAGSEIGVGNAFTVTATIENTGGTKATDVEATIAIITGDATIQGEATKAVAPTELPVGDTGEITWTLTAGAEGPVTIGVTPAGIDFTTGAAIPEVDLFSDTVDILQVELVPVLSVDITKPATGSSVTVGDEFDFTAVVINTGHAEAISVDAVIAVTAGAATITGEATQIISALPIGGSATVTAWTVTCTAVGAVTIEVTLTGQYLVGEIPTDIPEANLTSDSIALTPQLATALEVTGIVAPGTVKVGEEFDVIATVENTGEATAKDIEATVEVGTTADDVGTLTNAGNGVETEFVFSLTPKVVAGSLVITPSADIETIEIDWETGELTVTYTTAPGAPDPDWIDITADYTYFTPDVVAGLAEVVSDIPVELGTLAGDGETQATFTLLCLDVGDAFIRVNLTGKDANTKVAIPGVNLQPLSTTVTQKEAAVLEVTISAPIGQPYDVGEEFDVTATVTNTGKATAKAVTLTLSIDANAALAEGEVATQTVGYLGPGDSEVGVTWTLECTAAGKSKITVTPSGTDVLTGEAIPAGSLVADSVTVLQSITEITGLPISEGWNLISLPLIPTDPSIGEILAGVAAAGSGDVTVNKVAYYTGGPDGDWLNYIASDPDVSDLTLMSDGKGYWIDVSVDVGESPTFTAYGVQLALPGQSPPTYDVVVGWNLIGFTGTAGVNVEAYLVAVMDSVQAMYEYDTDLGAYTAVIEGVTTLTPGAGYWLAVNTAGKIYP